MTAWDSYFFLSDFSISAFFFAYRLASLSGIMPGTVILMIVRRLRMASSTTSSRPRINSEWGSSVRKISRRLNVSWWSPNAECVALGLPKRELTANATLSCVCNETIRRLTSIHAFLYVELEIHRFLRVVARLSRRRPPRAEEERRNEGREYVRR